MTIEVRGVSYPTGQAAADALGLLVDTVLYRVRSPHFPDYRRLARGRIGRPPVPEFASSRPIIPPRVNAVRPLVVPERWRWDGDLLRREAVVDPNFDPPRVLRRVGFVRCLRCKRPTFSTNVRAVRMCWRCGGSGSTPVGPRVLDLEDLRCEAEEDAPTFD